MSTTFSIFIPVWNEAEWLPGAIESVLAQTFTDWELVIGDNASADDLAEVAARYPDPRIRYQRWDTHTEIFQNYNRTMQLCRNEWVMLLSADDRLHPRCLETFVHRLEALADESPEPSIVLSRCRRVTPNGESADSTYYRHWRVSQLAGGLYDAAAWIRHMAAPGMLPWNLGSVAFRRDILNEAGGYFRPEVGACADSELILRLAAYGPVLYIDEPLLDYTVRPDSDNWERARRDLRRNLPVVPYAAALIEGLHVHEHVGTVGRQERAAVASASARALLQRALQHRYVSGGLGVRGAAQDVVRAFRASPFTVFRPWQFAQATASVLAPAALIAAKRDALAARRRAEVTSESAPEQSAPSVAPARQAVS